MKIPFSKSRSRGQAFVEFAVSVVVLIIMGFGAVDLSRAISTYQRMNSVGREAGRVFLKSAFDTTNVNDTTLKPEVTSKVYNVIKEAMAPDDLEVDGSVLISVARRIIPSTESESSDTTDQLKITHQFSYTGTGSDAPSPISRIPDDGNDKIIAGPPESSGSYEGFVPVTTVRLGEELIIIEIFFNFQFMTGIDKWVPQMKLDTLYDRTVF